MFNRILSGDYPRSRALSALLVLIGVCLALGPFLFPGVRAFSMLGMICVFIIVVASYDLMLGYTHIVSFAHTMFFGIGAYGVAMSTDAFGSGFGAGGGGCERREGRDRPGHGASGEVGEDCLRRSRVSRIHCICPSQMGRPSGDFDQSRSPYSLIL